MDLQIQKASDGTVARYKARLVANGNQQYEGLDFTETFNPMIKHPTIRVVLILALTHQWPIKQLDVSNAFLHGVIEEDVSMRQRLGHKSSEHPSYVYKLIKPCWLKTCSKSLVLSVFWILDATRFLPWQS